MGINLLKEGHAAYSQCDTWRNFHRDSCKKNNLNQSKNTTIRLFDKADWCTTCSQPSVNQYSINRLIDSC